MPIPIEVIYRTTGKNKKTRNVIGIICPTALSQSMGLSNPKPIRVDMGDVVVDWNETSHGFNMLESYNAALTGAEGVRVEGTVMQLED